MGFRNVTLWDGTQKTVSDEDADILEGAGNASAQTDQQAAAGANANQREQDYGGADSAAWAFATHALNTATMGVTGLITDSEASKDRDALHGTAATLGDVAGFLAPTGLLGASAKTVGRMLPVGMATRAGEALAARAGSKALGRAAEGALWGVGGVTAEASIHGDPLTVEAAIEGAGVGAIMNWGLGALSDKVLGAASKAKASIAAGRTAKAVREEAAEFAQKLEGGTPSWDEFTETVSGAMDAARKANRESVYAAEAWATATKAQNVQKAAKQMQGARDEVLARLMETRYGKTVKAARDAKSAEQAGFADQWKAAEQEFEGEVQAAMAKHAEAMGAHEKAVADAEKSYQQALKDHEGATLAGENVKESLALKAKSDAEAVREAAVAKLEKAKAESERAYEQAVAEATGAKKPEIEAYTRARRHYDKYVGSTTAFARDLKKFGNAIDDLGETYGGVGEVAQEGQAAALEAQLEGSVAAGATTKGAQAAKGPQDVFADAIHDAARKVGGRKAPIASVYANMRGPLKPADLDQFKAMLAKMRPTGKVKLSRADMGLDEELMAASATLDDGATHHFVEVPEVAAAAKAAPKAAPKAAGAPASVATEIRDFKALLSKAHKARAAGNSEEALEHLAELRDKMKRFSHLEIPDLPTRPVAPGEPVLPPRPETPTTADEGWEWINERAERDVKKIATADNPLHPAPPTKPTLPPAPAEPTLPTAPKYPAPPKPFELPPRLGNVDDAQILSHVATDLDRSINEALTLLRNGDAAGAVTTLRAVEGRVKVTEGFADLILPELPAPPPMPTGYTPVKLPKSLAQFGRMTQPKIDALNDLAANNPSVAAALEKLSADLGLKVANPAALHGTIATHLRNVAKEAAETAAAKATRTAKGGGWFEMLKDKAQLGFTRGIGRTADIGGVKGAVGRAVVGGAAGYAIDGTEGAIMGSALMSGKLGMRAKITNAVSKLSGTGRALGKLGPVTSYLAGGVFSGEPDESGEKDARKQAGARINEILMARTSAADSLYAAIEPLMGMSGDMAWKIHNQTLNAVNHLADTLPKDPGIDVTPKGSRWTPSYSKSVELAHRIEAVVNPLDAVERSIRGDSHPAASETLWTVWPALMSEAASEVAMVAPEMNLTHAEGSRLSKLFRVALTGLQDQAVVTALQGLYLPQPEQPNQGSGRPNSGGGSAPNPGGRPPAVSSPLAGSSPGALTNGR